MSTTSDCKALSLISSIKMSAMSQQERKMKVVLRIHKFSFLQFFHLFVLMIRLKHRGACLYLVQIILINLIDPAHTVIRLVSS